MRSLLWGLVCLSLFTTFGCNGGDIAAPAPAPSANAPMNMDAGDAGAADSSVAALGYIPEGAVCPEEAAISSFEYPLSRPLFIYVDKAALKRPEVVAFVRFYVSDEGQQLLKSEDYSALKPEEIKATRDAFEAAVAAAGTESSSELKGTFKIDGSSTVYPVSQAVAETFVKAHPGVNITVNSSGTGTGFKMLAGGEIQISDASRAIKEGELSAAKSNNIDPLELKVGIDGLTVVVNPQNTWVDGLTIEHLKKIWEPGSKVNKWSDLDPSWPAEPMVLCGPGTESGTYDYFVEAVLPEAKKMHTSYQSSPNDNTTVNIVADNKYALGYFGYSYYVENQDKVKALCIAK
jgi:phosphate binding protein